MIRARVPERVHHRAGTPPYEIVAIAASAGGLTALTTVLGRLPANFAAAVVVVQQAAADVACLEEIAGRWRAQMVNAVGAVA